MDFLIIGNPESPRVRLFQEAVEDHPAATALVLAHEDLLTGKKNLETVLSPGCMIKIESPGQHFGVERELILAGAQFSGTGVCESPDELAFDKGRILYPRLWYMGWKHYLGNLSTTVDCFNAGLAPGKAVRFMNRPEDILTMYDKTETHRRLCKNNVVTAPSLGDISSFDHLHSMMEELRIYRVFIKLRYGSSASGMVAYEFSPRLNRAVAVTTAEMVGDRGNLLFYNSRKLRKYSDRSAVRSLIGFLCGQGVHVEKWIPKRFHNGKAYDVRVVTISHKACHRIARMSKSPMTNLHLGNQRKAIDESWCDAETISRMEKTAERASEIYPDSLYSGMDILFPSGGETPVVLEANAFGDFLNSVSFNGMTPYQYQVHILCGDVH